MSGKTSGGYFSQKELRMLLPDINGGVCFSGSSGESRDNVCSDMLNMWFKDGVLKTRPGLSHPYPDFSKGTIHSICPRTFFDRIVFHAGNCICSFDGENSPTVLSENVDDCDSFFCEIASTLYIYTKDEHIYRISQDFSVETVTPYVPTIIRNATNSLTQYDTYEDFNLLSRRITVRYNHSSYSSSYKLPYEADTSIPPTLRFEGSDTIYESSSYFMSENRIKFYTSSSHKYVDITYTVKRGCEADKAHMIFGCRFSECFGGTTMEGTRLFLSGNPDYPGHFFRSELLNPTYFKDLSFDIIGTGNDAITAFAKQQGNMLVFTKRSVGRITYSFDNSGAEFSVKEVNSRIGCDMPGSIALVNNKTVFANSSGGIYLIDNTENSDELNIVRISGNIMGSLPLGTGFVCDSMSDKQSCTSADYDGYYFLFVGKKAYVWDYSETPYFSTAYGKTNEQRLAWYVFDGIDAAFAIKTEKSELFIFRRSDQTPSLFSEANTDDYGLPISSFFVTKSYDADMPHLEKHLKRLLITLSGGRNSHVTLSVLAGGKNGKVLFTKKISAKRFSWDSFNWNTLCLNSTSEKSHIIMLPPMKQRNYAVKAECSDGVFGASELECIFGKKL